jgi:hypothetical protein
VEKQMNNNTYNNNNSNNNEVENWNALIEWTPEIMLEVELQKPDDFLKIAETLTRIGIETRSNNQAENRPRLIQSCHILHKRGRYFLVHFKEMFKLDGKVANSTVSDIFRRNTIAKLLEDWELFNIKNPFQIENEMFDNLKQIKILSFKQKQDYDLVSKYTIGNKMNRNKEIFMEY